MSERDVVRRLNRLHTEYYGAIAAIVDHHHADVLTDAADLIERLTRELSEARQGWSGPFLQGEAWVGFDLDGTLAFARYELDGYSKPTRPATLILHPQARDSGGEG